MKWAFQRCGTVLLVDLLVGPLEGIKLDEFIFHYFSTVFIQFVNNSLFGPHYINFCTSIDRQ